MKIIVTSRNIELTDAIKGFVDDKMSRIGQHYDFVFEIHVFLSVEKNPSIHDSQIAEATVHVNGAVLRVEASSDSLYASIDKLHDKVERGLRKHKTKIFQRTKANHESIRHLGVDEGITDEAETDHDPDLDDIHVSFLEEEPAAS
jgi:putative sigma-54 modulation protein